jgi:hypothetical protein
MVWRLTVVLTSVLAFQTFSSRTLGVRVDVLVMDDRAASGLNAGAQSARLGASHAALMLADVREALGPLQQLAGSAARSDKDPWLDYELGAGRDADALLTAVRSRVPK